MSSDVGGLEVLAEVLQDNYDRKMDEALADADPENFREGIPIEMWRALA